MEKELEKHILEDEVKHAENVNTEIKVKEETVKETDFKATSEDELL